MSAPPSVSPLGLRLVHAALFLLLAAGALASSLPEWRTLVRGLSGGAWAGAPLRAAVLLFSGLAVGGALLILAALLRGRSAPPRASHAVLAGLCVCGVLQQRPAERPGAAHLNRQLLEAGREVHLRMVEALQGRGEAPSLQEAVALLRQSGVEERVELRGGLGWRLGVEVVPVASREQLPQAAPGTLLLWRSPDGAAFALRPVGLTEEGRAWPLEDGRGGALWLNGAFNPELAGAEGG